MFVMQYRLRLGYELTQINNWRNCKSKTQRYFRQVQSGNVED